MFCSTSHSTTNFEVYKDPLYLLHLLGDLATPVTEAHAGQVLRKSIDQLLTDWWLRPSLPKFVRYAGFVTIHMGGGTKRCQNSNIRSGKRSLLLSKWNSLNWCLRLIIPGCGKVPNTVKGDYKRVAMR